MASGFRVSSLNTVMAILLLAVLFSIALPSGVYAQTTWQDEWEKTLTATKKERKVVVGIPPSAELRKALESAFKSKFGFELELFLLPAHKSPTVS